MAESLSEMLVFQKLIEGKGTNFDINSLYTPILIILIIWYLLISKEGHICSNCKNIIIPPIQQPMQQPMQVSYMNSPLVNMESINRTSYLEKLKQIEFNPY